MSDIKAEAANSIYEVGYSLVPTLEESEVPEFASKIKAAIEGDGGAIISEETPTLRTLAYDISKSNASKNQKFNKAYFGWVKFEIEVPQIEKVKKALEAERDILRFIIVKTVRENTMFHPKFSRPKKMDKASYSEGTTEVKEVSEEEIDKSIEDLVIS